jgi:hypothetical protein
MDVHRAGARCIPKTYWEKNVHRGIENLLAEIKKLAGTPLSARVDGP